MLFQNNFRHAEFTTKITSLQSNIRPIPTVITMMHSLLKSMA